MSEKKIVMSTAGSREEAQRIARALVERRLAACVNVTGPIESVYWWKEAVESAQEWLLIVKTAADRFAEVRDTISELHSYELPECIQLPIETGSEAYLQWIDDSLR